MKQTSYSLLLTPREKEIEIAICKNGIITNFDLTNHFKISNSTLHSHLQSIYSKWGVDSKAELIYKFYQKHNAQNAF